MQRLLYEGYLFTTKEGKKELRKLLNTLYITKETGYLSLNGENVVLTEDGTEVLRLPFTNIESIVCMSYLGCSPALMGKCAEHQIGLSFISPSGRFLARVVGPIKGNVYLRKTQLELTQIQQVALVQSTIAAKLKNTQTLLKRSLRDNGDTLACEISACIATLSENQKQLTVTQDMDVLRGLEGHSAKSYFHVFDKLFSQQKEDFRMHGRTKQPPLDPVNAVLSFLYTICTNDIASALECVGLDPYIGFYHTLRPGRASLACDLVEEFRCLIERLVISLINLKVIQKEDFEYQVSGAVLLNENGRKKIITAWQNKKRELLIHPYLKEKIAIGLFPYIQANLYAKYIRGEIDHYPNLIWK